MGNPRGLCGSKYKVIKVKHFLLATRPLKKSNTFLLKPFTKSLSAELQKVGIPVSRIPDNSGRKSGHFKIVAYFA